MGLIEKEVVNVSQRVFVDNAGTNKEGCTEINLTLKFATCKSQVSTIWIKFDEFMVEHLAHELRTPYERGKNGKSRGIVGETNSYFDNQIIYFQKN